MYPRFLDSRNILVSIHPESLFNAPTYHDGYFEASRTVLGPWVEEVKK
jgi:hypothetical protein